MGDVIHLPAPAELSTEQSIYWQQVLETAERAREYALRMLGRLPIEAGIDEQ